MIIEKRREPVTDNLGMIKTTWLVVIALYICVVSNTPCAIAAPKVPCFFIFGDSLSDSGNNNKLSTSAKANYAPYGIDHPKGPTGRFCNGRTIVDILAEYLGFNNSISAFTSAQGNEILEGANYASGSAGILQNTGRHLGNNINFSEQITYHGIIMSRLNKTLGSNKAVKQHLNKCLYWVEIGSNDYINNYFSPHHYYSSSAKYTPEKFAALLIEQYRSQIMMLYKYGATKVALVGLGRIGCTPNSIALHPNNNGSHCVDLINNAVQHFNVKLLTLVDELNTKLSNVKFTFIDSFAMGAGDATVLGFKVMNVPCCPVNINGLCVPFKKPCKNRREYLFWDAFHPTEALNMFTTRKIYTTYDLSNSSPMDVNNHAQLSFNDQAHPDN